MQNSSCSQIFWFLDWRLEKLWHEHLSNLLIIILLLQWCRSVGFNFSFDNKNLVLTLLTATTNIVQTSRERHNLFKTTVGNNQLGNKNLLLYFALSSVFNFLNLFIRTVILYHKSQKSVQLHSNHKKWGLLFLNQWFWLISKLLFSNHVSTHRYDLTLFENLMKNLCFRMFWMSMERRQSSNFILITVSSLLAISCVSGQGKNWLETHPDWEGSKWGISQPITDLLGHRQTILISIVMKFSHHY